MVARGAGVEPAPNDADGQWAEPQRGDRRPGNDWEGGKQQAREEEEAVKGMGVFAA